MTIIIFEGLPGSGKTTLINQLSEEFEISKVGEIIDKRFHEISPEKSKGLPQNFFLQSDKLKYFSAKKLSKNKPCLVDRGIFSTIAYNLCIKNKTKLSKKDYRPILKKYDLDCIYVYIKISSELSIKRKNKKMNEVLDLWSFKKNLKKINKFYDETFSKMDNVIIFEGSIEYDSLYNQIKKRLKEFI